MALVVNRRVRLGDDELLLAVGGQVFDLFGDPAVFDLAIRRFEKTEFVDARKRASDAIRPMFGPSGVSIGQMRP